MKTKQKEPNKNIELSVAEKNYNGAKNIWFESKSIPIKDLEKTFKSKNYSTIKWRDGNRKESNFLSSAGFIVDIDNGLSIHDAETRLKKHKLNYIIAPSKSHTPEKHRYHIILFFNQTVRSINTYKKIAKHFTSELFPESDPNVTDGARYIYGSPDSVSISSWFEGDYFDVDKFGELWDSSLEFINSDDDTLTVGDLDESDKIKIHCPFHDDSSPSAFIQYSDKSKNWFIFCSSCNQTFWMEDSGNRYAKITDPYWSYGTDVFEFGIANDEFFFEKIGEKKFHILTKTDKPKEEKERTFKYLIQHKHIRHISEINYIGDVNADKTNFSVDNKHGIITVKHAHIPVRVKDNKFIEHYLEDRFGKYKTFIKEYWAMFCYTNYVKLPTLIFKGKRGNGKSTFAEVTGEIYNPLTYDWSGHEQNFTYEVEKKLLIVEENEHSAQHQYKTIKKYSGQKWAKVEKKFKDPYRVRNNMNIILLANDSIPLYVSREEKPINEQNNQFFVYEFPPITGSLDVDIEKKLENRLGNYIVTELKTVYDNINTTGNRYGIKVPITDEETALFEDNVTDIEAEGDVFIRKLCDYEHSTVHFTYTTFIDEGYIPDQFFKEDNIMTQQYNRIIKSLKRRGYLKNGEIERIRKGNSRYYCHKMTDKLKDKIEDSKKWLSAQKGDCV